jgi:hypothetical protein
MFRSQGRVPGCTFVIPAAYSDYGNVSNSIVKQARRYKSLVLVARQEATTYAV